MVTNITSSLSAWASSQASNALSASALQKIYQIQANLIIKNNGNNSFIIPFPRDSEHLTYLNSSNC